MNLDQFTYDGKFLILALDHRESIKRLINPQNPELVTSEEIIKLKREIIKALKDQFSSLLIDPEYGLPAYTQKTKPYLLPIEKSGFREVNGERITEIQYSVSQIKNWGASGVKLLLHFNPYGQSSLGQLDTTKKVLAECKAYNFPLFLEVVTYELSGDSQKAGLVLDSLDMFVDNGIMPNVFKLEYPGNPQSCHNITEILQQTPWILLTGGDTFDIFKEKLQVATRAGAKGFLAGRSLWQELPTLKNADREIFLIKTLPERFRIIYEIAITHLT